MLALGSHTPLFGPMLRYFPGYDSQRCPGRFSFIIALHLFMLAGIGLDRLGDRGVSRKRFIVACLLAGAAVLACGIWMARTDGSTAGAWARLVNTAAMRGGSNAPPWLAPPTAAYLRATARVAGYETLGAGIALCLLAACVWASRFGAHWRWAAAGIGAVELTLFATLNLPTAPVVLDYPPQWAALASQPADARVMTPYLQFANTALAEDYQDAYGYDPIVLKRYADLLSATQRLNPDEQYFVPNVSAPHRAFAMLRCGDYFYLERGAPKVITIPDRLSRVQLLSDYRVLKERGAILEAICSPAFDPKRTVILEQVPEPSPAPGPADGEASVLRATSDTLEIRAQVRRPTILLITDSFSSGWRARAYPDSAAASYKILPANYALRAVALAAGSHHLLLEYSPLAFRVGMWVTIGSLLGYAAAWLYLLIQSGHREGAALESGVDS